jgi:spore maturation protein SpmA
MKAMEKEEQANGVATDNMALFVAMNTSSLQLLPTTTAMLRSAAGSHAPMEILPAVWLASTVSVLSGIFAFQASGALLEVSPYEIHQRLGHSVYPVLHRRDGFLRGVNVFDAFLRGARKGIGVAFRILPALVAIIVSVGIFKASGALDLLTYAISPITIHRASGRGSSAGALRPISGSARLRFSTTSSKPTGPTA